MIGLSGIFNVYFPFELKDDDAMQEIRRIYSKKRDLQIRYLRKNQIPRTGLMDIEILRREIEDILVYGTGLMSEDDIKSISPYATQNIASAFRLSREDNLFSMEISIKISDFEVVCYGVNDIGSPMYGTLYYFNNLGNCVGTYLLALKFSKLSIEQVILLKHAFYKRAEVRITEVPLSSEKTSTDWKTFQEYVCHKASTQKTRRASDIDCRARYTFLEIGDHKMTEQEKYGLLTANEKYKTICVTRDLLRNRSKDTTYEMYYDLRSVLVISSKNNDDIPKQKKKLFGKLNTIEGHIKIEIPEEDDMIAGLIKGKFPKFLKSVELHLLTNNAQRHETVRHELSYWNPYIFLRRRYRIWKILNELDVSNCFIDGGMLESFGVRENLDNLKEEYSQLNSHIINYSMLIVSIVAVLVAVLIAILKP